jgi:hypothetical protein
MYTNYMSREKTYKEEQRQLCLLKLQLRNLKEEIKKKRETCLQYKFLYYHPHINALEPFIPIYDIVQLCLGYIGQEFCIKCKQLYLGDECLHGGNTISYVLKGDLIAQKHCQSDSDNVHFIEYVCYKVESVEDQQVFNYWKNFLNSKLYQDKRCCAHKKQHIWPQFIDTLGSDQEVIRKGRKIWLMPNGQHDQLYMIDFGYWLNGPPL